MDKSSSHSHDKLNITHEDYLEFSKTFVNDCDVGYVYADAELQGSDGRLSKAIVKKRCKLYNMAFVWVALNCFIEIGLFFFHSLANSLAENISIFNILI